MKSNENHITVFEHQVLRLDQPFPSGQFDSKKLKALQAFYGEKGVPYYSLIHNGVKFCEYVGVLQIGDLTIEVLPKADKHENESHWRSMLIGMLRAVGVFTIHAPSQSDLKLKPNSILHLYFELFIQEVESLLHQGLRKKYRRQEGNSKALKGSIQFGKQIQQNIVHKERFYIKQTVFDTQHLLNQILFKAIGLIRQINSSANLHARIGNLLLNFPEQQDLRVDNALFERIEFDRKTEGYRKSISIARLLLLNYHPDLMCGRNNVLALMFDMNSLWEQFVFASVAKHKTDGLTVKAQQSKLFWKPKGGDRVTVRPDIVLSKGNVCAVLDTKWKYLGTYSPSSNDLRQMYVYHKYFSAKRVALVYPGQMNSREGVYYEKDGSLGIDECSLLPLSLRKNIDEWQSSIHKECQAWLNKPPITTA